MAGSANSIVARNVLKGTLNANNLMEGHVDTAFNPTYALVDEAGNQIALYIDSSNYQFYAELKDKNGNHINSSNIIDLPLESMVVNGSYDAETKEVVLTLNNGNEVRFSVADLVEGLVSTEQLTTILGDYVKFTNYAGNSISGVFKTSNDYATETNNGILTSQTKTYSEYNNLNNNAFISKSTLENVITGKELTNKTYVDNADAVFEEDLFGNETVSGSGETITLNNTTDKTPLKIDLKGNTYQNGEPTPDTPIGIHVVSGDNSIKVEGKNFAYFPNGTDTKNGIDLTAQNGIVTLNNTATANAIFNFALPHYIESNTVCTISLNNSTINTGVSVRLYGETTGDTETSSNTEADTINKTNTFTTTKICKGIGVRVGNGKTVNNFELKIQLEKKDSATSYTPYVSQSYPINIGYDLPSDYQQVEYIETDGNQYIDTGYYLNSNNLNIKTKIYTPNIPSAEQDILSNQDETTGRFVLGLFSKRVFGYSKYGSSSPETNVFSPFYNGEATLDIEMDYNSATQIKTLIVNGETNTESFKNSISNSNQNIRLFWNTSVSSTTAHFIGKIYSMQIKIDNSLKFKFIPCYRKSNNEIGLYDLVSNTFFINQGTGTFTKGNDIPNGMELCKIGTYQDYIVKDNGKWYLKKEIGKVVLDGSEDWNVSSYWGKINTNVYYATTKNDIYFPDWTSNYCLSNYFTTYARSALYFLDEDGFGFSGTGGITNPSFTIRIDKTLASDTQNFQTWLSTHNTIVYYVLATPTYEEITDSTLINQLNALEKANSYDNQTNISQVNNDMPFELAVTAFIDSTAGKLAAAAAQINTLNEVDDNLSANKEDKSNKVATISASSTDTEYPTAKCVYDIIGDIETLLTTLDIGSGV